MVYRAFDLLAVGKHKALGDPFEARREALEKLVGSADDPGSVEVTPLVETPEDAEEWLQTGEGVIAKERELHTGPGSARAWSRSRGFEPPTAWSPAGARARRRGPWAR